MSNRIQKLAIGLAALLLSAGLAFAGEKDKQETMTGVVSDAMCGAKHAMPGGAVQCTRDCAKQGSKYALVVGDKVYTLEGGDKTALDKLAGAKAKVTGTVKGDTITVSAVGAGS